MTREEAQKILTMWMVSSRGADGQRGYIEGWFDKDDVEAFRMAIEALSAEAVQVVRCKDCRHRDLFSCPLTDNDFQKDEDYCSWGERKGGDDE